MKLPKFPLNKQETAVGIAAQIVLGCFLGIHHLLFYDGFEFELIGHETWAVILISTGIVEAYVNYYREDEN